MLSFDLLISMSIQPATKLAIGLLLHGLQFTVHLYLCRLYFHAFGAPDSVRGFATPNIILGLLEVFFVLIKLLPEGNGRELLLIVVKRDVVLEGSDLRLYVLLHVLL